MRHEQIASAPAKRLAIAIAFAAAFSMFAGCTIGTGFDAVGNVEKADLIGQHIGAVVEQLGEPHAYYATPDGQESHLTYETYIQGPELSTAGCVFLIAVAGSGGDCPTGGHYETRCARLRFGPDRRLADLHVPYLDADPCDEVSHEEFLPALPRSLDEIPQL